MKTTRLILAGGSGFLGRLLSRYFVDRAWDVVVLTRAPTRTANPVREIAWDGETPGDWERELDGAAALINLAGVSVNCRYHARNRRLILESRIRPTRVLGEAIARCAKPPSLWLNSSTATIYKHTFGPAWDEFGEIGGTPCAKDEFSVEVAQAWEREFFDARTPVTRKIALRTAMVLGTGRQRPSGTASSGAAWTGRQDGEWRSVRSWIHEHDFCRGIEWLIARDDLSGPVNLAAPNPVTNAEMMRIMRRLCGVRFGLPASPWMLEAGAFFLRTETELIIKSRRVISGRLPACGFKFRFESFEEAARDLEQQKTGRVRSLSPGRND